MVRPRRGFLLYNLSMSTSLFIDGENLRHYVENVLKNSKSKGKSINDIDLPKLLDIVLKDISVNSKTYYSAKLHIYPEYPKSINKSKKIIREQRILKTELEKSGFNFLISGHVRAFKVKNNVVFKEKGVDVRIAVDIVSTACDKKIDTVVLCSSDSDLQPAVKEARDRGLEIIYLGFEINPNKGLIYTTNHSILIRNSEILEALKKK